MKTFGEMLREARTLHDLTAPELAFNTKLTQSFIRAIERGAQNPSAKTALKIAKIFDKDAYLDESKTRLYWGDMWFDFKVSTRGQNHVPSHPKVLEDPGLPISLVMVVRSDGSANINYIGEPTWAIGILRQMADQIEAETS